MLRGRSLSSALASRIPARPLLITCQAGKLNKSKSGGKTQGSGAVKQQKKAANKLSRAGRRKDAAQASSLDPTLEAGAQEGEAGPSESPADAALSRQRSASKRSRNRKAVRLDLLFWNPPRRPVGEMDASFLPKVEELATEIRSKGLKGRPVDVYLYKNRHYVRAMLSARLVALSKVENALSCPVRILNHDPDAALPPGFEEASQYFVPYSKAPVLAWLKGEVETPRPKGRGKTIVADGSEKKSPNSNPNSKARDQTEGGQSAPAAGQGASKGAAKPKAVSPTGGLAGLGALAALKKKL